MTTLFLDRSTPDMRRGACPALSTPMQTGDGLLARVALIDVITPAELAELCRLARRHGNGILDISARGNLQVRGLNETSAPVLDADVRVLNLPLREGLAVETPPLAGMDDTEIADPRPIAEAIRQGARDIPGLAPKMSVVVDGGGRLRLSGLLADIRLAAVSSDEGIRWTLLLGGTETAGRVFNVLRETEAVSAILALLRKLGEKGPKARGRDLAAGLPTNGAPGQPASPFGTFRLSGHRFAAGIGPAFGQTNAESLIALCDEAERLGIQSLKPAFDHSLLFFGAQTACEALTAFAGSNGFITSPSDPRSAIAACSGSPACNSAAIATHELAAKAAEECGDLLDGSFKLHVTGCPKGCAYPQPSALALCGTTAGLSLITQGKAADEPFASVAFADTNNSLRRIADLVRNERQAGENSAACLARLGPRRLAAAVTSGRS
ncbi:precorrin-3B synthase [Neorhizobium galegae]|uniref:Precorrin-3B synthase n=1 Tax=Neorhizobium galegae bv. orientalis str. HAMBI 540 TaxID=1028800 RepID=A0A068SWE9_NEOGA|nr:precorrin-3B synthase [Neorhizobium galegae]MCQ1855338.1 precorrin-3B synthase [Neorhizobium galegae]CDN50106.1 Precorrin-3B synthase [Neorhizobium galegae bv. orientalis str. HAMBI 540]CDZ52192.1 Precorrin-3B synthase [Neorhizobium galegae bv. orientalis]